MYLQEHYIEIIGAGTSLLYLFFEITRKKIMWVVGFFASAFYVYIFYDAKFYADMGLNIYYLLASVYGWIAWSANSHSTKENTSAKPSVVLSIKKLKPTLALKLAGISCLLFALLSFILSRYTDSPVPYGDALTTALSIVATWMLAHKIIEQWWVWLFVNTVSMGLYVWRGLYPTAILFLCYAAASIIGYYQWEKERTKIVQKKSV